MSRWEDLLEEVFEFEVLEDEVKKESPESIEETEVTNMKTPMERLKYAMNCKPMKSVDAAEAYLKIASMCKSFDEMPIPMQNYITQVEEEFGYEAPESMV